MLADLISGELPYLRRYARALLGTRSAGDAAVETMLETKMLVMLGQGKTVAQRKDLFRALDETIMEELSDGKLNQEVAKILRSMTTDERRAVMLTAVEGFSIFETAEILSTSTSFVEEALTNAETSLQSALSTTVLVIEDEILIAEMLAGIVLGMGMPTTPAYIVQVALLVPALVNMGVSIPAAHMFVFYYAILSAITPPVAIAVYAACGIAQSPVMATSMVAVRLGLTGYIIPFMFVFGPSLLMIGTVTEIVLTAFSATMGVTFLAAGLAGFLLRPTGWISRLLLVAAALTLINPGIVTDTIGLSLGVLALFLNSRERSDAWDEENNEPKVSLSETLKVEAAQRAKR